jgi:hypothetical protein
LQQSVWVALNVINNSASDNFCFLNFCGNECIGVF